MKGRSKRKKVKDFPDKRFFLLLLLLFTMTPTSIVDITMHIATMTTSYSADSRVFEMSVVIPSCV